MSQRAAAVRAPRKAAPLALTFGEPAGIGPDISLLAWLDRKRFKLPAFYVIGDADYLIRRAADIGLDVPVTVTEPNKAADVFPHALPVSPLDLKATARAGQPDRSSADIVIASIRRAVSDVFAHRCSAVVTNPIAKNVVYGAGFSHPGHTEFLAELAAQATGEKTLPVMMLWSPELAVVPVTIHIALKEVPGRLTTDLIVATGQIVVRALSERFGVARPRLVATGLNPHAGEDGTIGLEERTIIAPAISRLAATGIDIHGPVAADTLFHADRRRTYDAVLCMYHDQALIPIKTLAFDHAVNVTLGLPFIRTSPDHGTAFDIAGTGRANPASLAAAMTLAARLSSAAPALTGQ